VTEVLVQAGPDDQDAELAQQLAKLYAPSAWV
jgi:hypothetical protein